MATRGALLVGFAATCLPLSVGVTIGIHSWQPTTDQVKDAVNDADVGVEDPEDEDEDESREVAADVSFDTLDTGLVQHYNVSEWRAAQLAALSWPRWPWSNKAITDTDANEQPAKAAENLCQQGWMVPEVFIVGCVSCSTTSLSFELGLHPSIQFCTGYGRHKLRDGSTYKEGNFFDYYWPARKIDGKTVSSAEYMRKSFEPCKEHVRKIAAEASPRYYADARVPARISQTYGDTAHRLKFIFMLREPLSRLHSDFYHSQRSHWCPQLDVMSFPQLIDTILDGNMTHFVGGDNGCTDRLEMSLYNYLFVRWFAWFDARQFTVVPWLYQVAAGTDGRPQRSVAETLWESWGLKNGSAPSYKAAHLMDGEHTRLKDEAWSPGAFDRIRAFFDTVTGPERLAQIFAGTGVNLYGYTGKSDDQANIASWITQNWDTPDEVEAAVPGRVRVPVKDRIRV